MLEHVTGSTTIILMDAKGEIHFSLILMGKPTNNSLKGVRLPTIHHSALLWLFSKTYQAFVSVQVLFNCLHLALT